MTQIVKWSDKKGPKLKAINLELTNHCNYKCSFCLNNNDDFRLKGYASPELIDKVIKELDKDISISICGIGEPSMHPDFVPILERLSAKFDNLSIVTNGYAFRSPKLIKAILDSTIKKVNFSLDYIDSAQYKQIKGGDIKPVLSYLNEFLALRKQHNNKPLIQINYLYEKEKSDYMEALNFFNGIMDDPWCIYIRKIKNLAGQVDIDEEADEEKLDQIFKDLVGKNLVVENWNRYLKHTNFLTEKPKICRHIYDYYMLLWNGDVVPCCVDFNASMAIANVFDEGLNLTDLFYSDRYNWFRAKMESLDYRVLPLCRRCSDYYKA